MLSVREALNRPVAKFVTIAVLLVVGVIAIWQITGMFTRSSIAVRSQDRWFVCSETLKPFQDRLQAGQTVPIQSPYSGKKTGYVAELCFWTADGKIKEEPTPVLMNEFAGKPDPTFCPECGRLVVAHNPRPDGQSTPPATKTEYESRRNGR